MFAALKKLLSAAHRSRRWSEAAAWARSQNAVLKPIRDQDGFVIEGESQGRAWRLEWGPSRRIYIPGPELRLIAHDALPPEMLLLAANRHLAAEMEKTVFEQFTGAVQTRADLNTPEEMRWLVMIPKVPASDVPKVRTHWMALASHVPWMVHWLNSSLGDALGAHYPQHSPVTHPAVWVGLRGKLTLRTGLATPTAAALDYWLKLFTLATAQAAQVGLAPPPAPDSRSDLDASTTPALWMPSQMPTLPIGDTDDAPRPPQGHGSQPVH
ncbi:hypothetical protein [Amphibiibacter pelophylacis]|uniref:Uncharacterized protein n=1 Tax=Amphibiibacter pelophylacis TaxID=1799477 RepID=A0ACC6P160_9BURK